MSTKSADGREHTIKLEQLVDLRLLPSRRLRPPLGVPSSSGTQHTNGMPSWNTGIGRFLALI
jgi:hypothetical protein